MRKYLYAFCLTAAIVLAACSGSSDNEKTLTLRKGSYNYFVTDSAGNSLVEGMMMIDSVIKMKKGEPNTYSISGTYTITKMTTDTSYHGFSTMNGGKFTGLYNDSLKTLGINTNPQIADANIFLNANVTATELAGYWYFSTFRGKDKEGGFFKANRIR